MLEILEEEGPPGPPCFATRIRREPPVPHFQLPWGPETYDDRTKPEDWLNDYVSPVHITGGNRRWAMRYIPRMLEGPARIWLNNLKENSIEVWLDFKEAFTSNFSSTYQRMNHPNNLPCAGREKMRPIGST